MIMLASLVFALNAAFAAGPYQLTFTDVRAEATLAQDPPPTNYTSFLLQFKDANGQPTDPQSQPKVGVFMEMGKHRHGSDPTRVKAVTGIRGQYEVSNVNFYMPGEWVIEVTLDRGGGNSEMKSFKVTAGSGGHQHH